MQNQSLKTILPGVPFGRKKTPKPHGAQSVWIKVRLISGLFAVAVGFLLFVGHAGSDALDPLKSTELKTLKEKLRLNPADESTKEAVRGMDLRVRNRYFHQLAQSTSGVYLLLGGVVVFLVAAAKCARYRKELPMPRSSSGLPTAAMSAQAARWSVSAMGATVATVLVLLGLGLGKAAPDQPPKGVSADLSASAGASQPAAASQEELNQNWPRFRGPGGAGVSRATNVPANWDVKTGSGIGWKVPVPAPGFNSPIIWHNHFFFSGGDSNRREVFSYDCANGQMLWRQPVENVPGAANSAEIPETTGYAASSMATDGSRVYVIFATGEVAAFGLDGKRAWAKNFGPLKNPYGHATSLLTWQDKLILLLDQGESEESKSKLYALDGRTGQIVWQTARKVGSSWATPVTFDAAGQAQVVALAIPWAISYRLSDGVELWRVECLNGEVTPSPALAGGLVLVPSPSEKLLAIRPDGHGDVTKSNVVWSTEENVPDVTSPVSNGELTFTLTTPGLLTCFDNKDGKKLWEHDFEMECHASPSIAAGRVYVFGQKGTAVVADAGRQFKELFRADMPDVFHASPAFTPNMIILRGTTNLWGLVSGPK